MNQIPLTETVEQPNNISAKIIWGFLNLVGILMMLGTFGIFINWSDKTSSMFEFNLATSLSFIVLILGVGIGSALVGIAQVISCNVDTNDGLYKSFLRMNKSIEA
jgi:hypothetical protein